MITEELACWDDFVARVTSLRAEREAASTEGTHHSDLLFRGQSNSEWSLSTTLERWTGENLYVRRYHLALTSIQDEFESRIGTSWEIPNCPAFERLLANGDEGETHFVRLLRESQLYEYMVYLRHHGFPSPLLDWTTSPYVAAYFAFAKAKPEAAVAIYAYQEYAGHGKGGWAAHPRIEQLGPHIRTHVRHFQQQAQYTVAVEDEGRDLRYSTHESALGNSERETQDQTWKFTVPGSERKRALQYLQLHNLTAYALFGSEESLAESLAIREFTLRE